MAAAKKAMPFTPTKGSKAKPNPMTDMADGMAKKKPMPFKKKGK